MIEAGLGQQKRQTIAQRARDRVPPRYLAASTGPALALGRIADKHAWGGAAPRPAPASPGETEISATLSIAMTTSKEAKPWTPTPAPDSTKQ